MVDRHVTPKGAELAHVLFDEGENLRFPKLDGKDAMDDNGDLPQRSQMVDHILIRSLFRLAMRVRVQPLDTLVLSQPLLRADFLERYALEALHDALRFIRSERVLRSWLHLFKPLLEPK